MKKSIIKQLRINYNTTINTIINTIYRVEPLLSIPSSLTERQTTWSTNWLQLDDGGTLEPTIGSVGDTISEDDINW